MSSMALSLAPRLQPGNLLAAADSALDHNARAASASVTSFSLRSCKHSSGVQLISKAAARRSLQRIGHFTPVCQVATVERVTTVKKNPRQVKDDAALLADVHSKADRLVEEFQDTSIYLVGMMGCGKTTVGRILSEALGYGFFDSDSLVEQTVGCSVASIFSERGEPVFRDLESAAIAQLASMGRLVVATGGGAILRPANWKCMRTGITIWLDVPLEALAKRVVAAGVESRPILSQDSADSDPYLQALTKLQSVYSKRKSIYPGADVRVSLEGIVDSRGLENVSEVSALLIVSEILDEVKSLLEKRAITNDESVDFNCARDDVDQCLLPFGLASRQQVQNERVIASY